MRTVWDVPGKPAGLEKVPFGEFLVSKRLLTQKGLAAALAEQRDKGGRLGEVVIKMKLLGCEEVSRALAERFSMDYVSLRDIAQIDLRTARMLPASISRRFGVLAIAEIGNKLIVAVSDPCNSIAIDTIKLKTRRPLKIVLSSKDQIYSAIDAIYAEGDSQICKNCIGRAGYDGR
jgi:hypothetical protein